MIVDTTHPDYPREQPNRTTALPVAPADVRRAVCTACVHGNDVGQHTVHCRLKGERQIATAPTRTQAYAANVAKALVSFRFARDG